MRLNDFPNAMAVLFLAEETSSTFVPQYFAILYLISRSGDDDDTQS